MPIRNMWSLEVGECIVAEELSKRVECHVFFPIHDVGIDLLAVKGKKHASIQVKESRHHARMGGHSWHQLYRAKFLKGVVDFCVFLTYLPIIGEHKVSRLDQKFLIVPSSELGRRLAIKHTAGKKQVYDFYFHFEKEKVIDQRVTMQESPLSDYTEFLNAWELIGKALS
jgi:hypothetical protein